MRTSRTPYVIPIARAFMVWQLREIFFVMARQMAKTNGVIFNVAGQRLDDDPTPILYIGPTRDNVDDVIEPKVQFMLESTASLWSKTLRGQKCKKHVKIVNSVSLRFTWAGSDTGLKADAAGVVMIDEIDGIEAERPTAGEGTVVDMAQAITASFPEGVVGGTSTPTHGSVEAERHPVTGLEHWARSDDVVSAIWRYWQECTRHEWSWPCPECSVYFIPRSKLLRPLEDVTPEQALEQGHIVCPNCGSEIRDKSRSWMNARGCMVAPGQKPADYQKDWGCVADDGPEGPGFLLHEEGGAQSVPVRVPWGDCVLPRGATNASFWVSGLCSFSARNTWGRMASKLVLALKSELPQRLQGVYNTLFGECFLARGETPPWTEVLSLAQRSTYRLGEVPEPVTTLTVGTDLNEAEIQYVVRGWVPSDDPNFESFLVQRGVLYGDTDQEDIWTQFKARVVDGVFGGLRVSLVAIDSGYREQRVYEFCAANDTCIPTKGRDTMDSWWKAARPEVDTRGKIKRYGLKLWHLNTDVLKSWVHSRIKHSARKEMVWHLPADIDDEYCKQIASESRLIDARGVPTWKKHRANHFLDCEGSAWFAANQIQILKTRPAPVGQEPTERPAYVASWQPSDPWLQG
jgi:phage terminase large subunit GpA-like protein